jgi:chemotaxis protein methyltransferase CheR
MDSATFNEFSQLIYERSGIHLAPGKEALVVARITKRMLALGMEFDFRRYLEWLQHDRSGQEVVRMIDAISTNQTSFFREMEHFVFVRAWFRERLARGQPRFRFWSAGCSTGEEPYSLAMTLADVPGALESDWRILATDISTAALRTGLAATYSPERLESVPQAMRLRDFVSSTPDGHCRVADHVRERVLFRRLNLSEIPFPQRGPLDVILCRNVMIYFDEAVRRRLLDEFLRLLRPGGFLIVGHCESLLATTHGFRQHRPSIYTRH